MSPKTSIALDVLVSTEQQGNKAFSCLFCTHLTITVSTMVSGRLGAMSRMEVILSSMN